MPGYSPTSLGRDLLLIATAAVAVVNGLWFSPIFDSVGYVLFLFTRGSRFLTPDILFHLTSVLITAATLMLGGIPAAIYERARGAVTSGAGSALIWLLATAVLSLPALLRLVFDDGGL